MELAILLTLVLLLLLPFFFFHSKRGSNKLLPPGSMGLPVIGQTFSLLKAMKADMIQEWFQERITKYGPIWKGSVFGYPTVFLHGPAANKFVYTYNGDKLSSKAPPTISRILGEKNIMELSCDDHRRVRAALVPFLKPESLKQYVAKIDEQIRHHLQMHWHGKHEIKVQLLMKKLTFNVICSFLFGTEEGSKRDQLLPLLKDVIGGVLAIPVNLPFTRYNRGLWAREKLKPILLDLIQEKEVALSEMGTSSHKDLITSLLSIRDEVTKLRLISDEEILDNIIGVMIAGYDTTSTLLTFFVRLLANNHSIRSAILHEQEEIAKSKESGEPLTWDDLTKMKYSWRVATEILRMNPPVNLTIRRAFQDIEYGGYIIPKGWQVAMTSSTTHMDNNIFNDPKTFNPARFEEQAPSAPPFAFVAFGGGRRMCPGIELAKMEFLAMVHHLVMQFTWELVLEDDSFVRDPMPTFNQGLPVRIAPRN